MEWKGKKSSKNKKANMEWMSTKKKKWKLWKLKKSKKEGQRYSDVCKKKQTKVEKFVEKMEKIVKETKIVLWSIKNKTRENTKQIKTKKEK